MLKKLVFFLLLGGLAVLPASATPIFTFAFNPVAYSSSTSNFTVDIMATITNTGTTAIDSVEMEEATFGTPANLNLTGSVFGSLPISAGSPLAAGDSLTFDFLNLSFTGLAPGTYTLLSEAHVELDDVTGAVATVVASNTPTVVVGSPVPEPSAFLLMATGAAGLLARVRRR
jgi:hypothetical protein